MNRSTTILTGQTRRIGTKLRLFIAIDLPASLCQALGATQENLRRELRDSAIGWSRIEGIHLTLKFLGDVEETRVSEVGERMTEIAEAWNPVRLELQAIGVFPSLKRPRILWRGIDGELHHM